MGSVGHRDARHTLASGLRNFVFCATLATGAILPGIGQSKPLYNTPVYDPASKSYFEMVYLEKSVNWKKANELAQQRVFKNTKGRLAVISDAETHSFLMRTFQPKENVFTGLRYSCKARKLYWTNGQEMKKSDFHAWAPQWDQSAGVGCQEGDMPVVYTSAAEGFRWVGKGAYKLYFAFFIEYPTGQP
jgi:hypothetical protein